MKILNTNSNSSSDFFQHRGNLSSRTTNLKKKKKEDFKTILEKTMGDQTDDWEEFRILLPKHGHFWDNGYEDLE
ncbi:MAG TPA: hypothetical protein VNJ08_10880 [Bacteriovoracaceae bacterium]|nr:hypothetical protein [Bacteriovoracaceae bacterium]